MIAAWMLYAVVTSALVGAAALAMEHLCRMHRWQTRWTWFLAMLAPIVLALLSLTPHATVQQASSGSSSFQIDDVNATPGIARVSADAFAKHLASSSAAELDDALLGVWLAASGVFGTVLIVGWVRLRRASRTWTRGSIAGTNVLIADRMGPAVLGMARPRIVAPRWLLDADHDTQRAAMAHERQHLAARDAQLTCAALALVVLTPWNLPLWWLLRRLRAAIEIDCDARVLRAGEAADRYGAALLAVAERRARAPMLAAAMQGPASALERRIEQLFPGRRRFTGFTGGALLLFAASLTWAAAQIETPPQPARDSAMDEKPAARALSRELVSVAEHGDLKAAAKLVEAGADVNYVRLGDGTPLIIAARNGDRALVDLLLLHGATPNLAVSGDGNALIVAAAGGHREIVALLLDRGADVNAVVIGDETPLINAARRGHLETVRDLVERGADVSLAVRADGLPWAETRSPLKEAEKRGHHAIVEYLRSKGAV